MWYLTSESDDKIIYVVPQKKEITVGRSPDQSICDYAIQEDPSISRKHAVLTNLDNRLYIKDLGSRYGTFVNNSKVDITNIQLNATDVVKFGKMGSIWKVHDGNFVTCTSTLKGENLTTLKHVLGKIGGVLKNDWDDTCKYLTMPAITLTIKVVLALVQGSHIVTTQFWNSCLSAITNNEGLPDPKSFCPEIVESTLNKDAVSFLPNNSRGGLFAGKKFIFFSKRQYDMYRPVLDKSSATPMLLSESKLSKTVLAEDDVVVIQYNIISTSQETESQRNQITEITNYLKGKGKRVIADAEIGLAILYVSTDKYCNPGFNYTSEVVRQAPVQVTHKVLAQETQDRTPTRKDNVIIDESLTSTNDENSSKRKMSDDEVETNACKKVATNITSTLTETAKRKYDDEGSNNPTKKMAIDNNSDDNDLFNFITPGSNDISNKTKSADKLNLAKPQKRKSGFDSNDDDLFNFVQNEENDTSRKMFEEDGVNAKKHKQNSPENISAMRGSKLEELNKINQNWNANVIKPNNIKKEHDDLDEKMNQLEIGSVVVTIRDSLIIKKEPIEIQNQSNGVKNFKKFKKVWPVKMQVTVIPKSSMSIVKPSVISLESENTLPPNAITDDPCLNAMESNDNPQESSLSY